MIPNKHTEQLPGTRRGGEGEKPDVEDLGSFEEHIKTILLRQSCVVTSSSSW